MDVSELFECDHIKQLIGNKELVEITGWLVVIDSELYVIEEKFSEPYGSSKKIKLSDPDIAFSVRDSISPLGGKSFVFHRSKIVGAFSGEGDFVFKVKYLSVEEAGVGLIEISLDSAFIEESKSKYPGLMKKYRTDSSDWLDYF